MRNKSFYRQALVIAIGLLIALTAPAQTKTPSGSVEIGELGSQVSVSLGVGDTLRVVLPSTPSTGYSWQVANGNAAVMAKSSSATKSGRQMPGAPGVQTLSFLAKSVGQDALTLNYARPWEKSSKPARSYAVNVTVGAAARSDLPSVTPSGTLLGTYSGKTLCADCSGIVTTVALYAASSEQLTDTYYVRTMKDLGSPKGDTTFVSAGKWSVKTGTPANAQAVVYSLGSNTSDHVDAYQLNGETLEVIGSDGKSAQNPYNSNLQKQ